MTELDDEVVAATPSALESRSGAPISVAVVDDCALFREGIAQALAGADGIGQVDETATLGEAMRIAYEKRPDIIVLSGTSMEPEITAIPTFRAVHPDARILVIGSDSQERRIKAALLAGAHAYVPKEVTRVELVDTIRAIHRDKTIVARATPPKDEAVALLTPREHQVLDKIAQGQSNKEIARALRISEKTVKQHITHILEKLDVHNRVEAALRASPDMV